MATNLQSDNVYQFRVVLKYIHPKIWRRIQVPGNYTFLDLHYAIQDSMMWLDYHLHEFRIKNPITGRDEVIDDRNEERKYIAKYFVKPGDKARYLYDFGDGWIHDIILQDIKPREIDVDYPRCLAGRRACPPEDCGGENGYQELLTILNDPQHPEYQERKEWIEIVVGGPYNPDSFDPKSVTFSL